MGGKLAPVGQNQSRELYLRQAEGREIPVYNCLGPLPFAHRLDPADLAEGDRSGREHLPVEGKNRFQQFRLHRRPRPFRYSLRQVEAQRRAGRNAQRDLGGSFIGCSLG